MSVVKSTTIIDPNIETESYLMTLRIRHFVAFHFKVSMNGNWESSDLMELTVWLFVDLWSHLNDGG
jgi:hypothetical protein